MSKANWIIFGEKDCKSLENELGDSVSSRIAAGKFSDANVRYISDMHLALAPQGLEISEESLEKLRRLCQLWDVDIRPSRISSHRKFIGPLIVKAKELLYPMLRVFLKDFIRQQRAFNAATIALIAEVVNKKEAKPAKES